MEFTEIVNTPEYGRWENERYIIQKFSEWNGVRGTFYMAYDKFILSKRVTAKPVGTFEEAAALCSL